jgi:endonuclease YncB( thermonuclease family)
MGVVTAVDGDTITVAGNGVTTKVLVSTNTTYTGSDKPAQVNDTIMAFGARDGSNNLVASTVRLSRQ